MSGQRAMAAIAPGPAGLVTPRRDLVTSHNMHEKFHLDSLLEDLAAGRYGGLPLPEPAISALALLLQRLDWAFDARKISAAVPHFPVQFGAQEIETVLYRLGFASTRQRRRGTEVLSLPDTALVIAPDGALYLPGRSETGQPTLTSPDTGREITVRRRTPYDCILFTRREDPTGPAPPDIESWFGTTWRRFTPEIRVLVALMFASNVLVILASLSTVKIFDTVLPSSAVDTLAALMLGLFGLFLLELRLRKIRAAVVARIAGRIEYLLGTALFSKLISLPLIMLTTAPINDQVTRLKQFETVRDFFNGPFVAIVLELPFVLILFAIIFALNVPLGLLTLGLVCTYAVLGMIMVPRLLRASRAMVRAKRAHVEFLLETVEHRQQIAQMGIGALWRDRLRPKTEALAAARRDADRVTRLFTTLAGAATPLSTGMIIVFGASMAIEGNVTGGELIGITILSTRLLSPVQQAAIAAVRGPELLSLFRQIDAMMRLDPNTRQTGNRIRADQNLTITLEGVGMRYPKAHAPALQGINLTLDAGEFVIIEGPSGAGKTTLLRVISGLYSVQIGTVRLAGANIDQFTRADLTRTIASAGDRSTQIHGTIAQNLLLARPELTRRDLEAITEELGVRAAIEALPDGFDTRLDYMRLSELPPGFKDLLSLAQVLLRGAPIILLDEALAALPPEYETLAIEALERRKGQSTIILVSQRPSHRRSADKIVSLSGGQIRAVKVRAPTEAEANP